MDEAFRRRRRQDMHRTALGNEQSPEMGCLYLLYWLLVTFVLCLAFTASSMILREVLVQSRQGLEVLSFLPPLIFSAFFVFTAMGALLGYDWARRVLLVVVAIVGTLSTCIGVISGGAVALTLFFMFGASVLVLHKAAPMTEGLPGQNPWHRVGTVLALIASVLFAAVIKQAM